MVELKNKKIVNVGCSNGVIIPVAYIKDGLLSKDKLYNIEFKEVV